MRIATALRVDSPQVVLTAGGKGVMVDVSAGRE